MKDGGSVQYRAMLYSVTKYHQITLQTNSKDEGTVDSGYRVEWGVEVLGIEIYNNVKYVSDNKSENEIGVHQSDFLKSLPEDYIVVECLDVTSGLLKTGTKYAIYQLDI